MTVLFSCNNIKKDFGYTSILKNINFKINEGQCVGLVGLNGAGKTTLANIIIGNLKADGGEVFWYKKNIKIGYLNQSIYYTESILEDVILNHGVEDTNRNFLKTSMNLGLHGVDHWDEEKIDGLSGGERTKLALAAIWTNRPELLILDEPTNHLDYSGVQWLVNEIKKFKGTVLVISHDRYFLDQCVNRVLEIENGVAINYNGNYSWYRDEKKKNYEITLQHYITQEKYVTKIHNEIDNLKNWSSKAHNESRKKAAAVVGNKEYYRLKAKKKDKQIKSRIKRLEKIKVQGIKKPKEEKKVYFGFDSVELKGKRVIEVNNIKKSFGQRVLFKDSSFYIQRGEKIGIFGDNGCGKTTLLKILIGEEDFDFGHVFFSSSAKIAYLSQDVLGIDKEKNILELFDVSSKEKRVETLNLLANMGFTIENINKNIGALSLGEVTRIRIASLILENNDVLILDEPINHLDLYSREKLEESLEKYNGTVILVSHDRYMIERICNRILLIKNEKIKRLEYGLKEYLDKENNKSKPKVKDKKINDEERLLIENRIAFVLGKLSNCDKKDSEYEKMDLEFKELIALRNAYKI